MSKEDQKQEIREWCKAQTVERLKEVVEAHKDASKGARYWLWVIAECELDRRDDISQWKSYVDIADAIKATDVEINGAKGKVKGYKLRYPLTGGQNQHTFHGYQSVMHYLQDNDYHEVRPGVFERTTKDHERRVAEIIEVEIDNFP